MKLKVYARLNRRFSICLNQQNINCYLLKRISKTSNKTSIRLGLIKILNHTKFIKEIPVCSVKYVVASK